MSNFTPAQVKALQGWTEQRDALLRDIGVLSPELSEIKTALINAGLALADLHKSIAEAEGRLSVLESLEQRTRDSIPHDIAELEVRKTRLQGECSVMEESLKRGKSMLHDAIIVTANLQSAHETMKDQSAIVGRVVGEVIQVSEKHISEVKNVMVEIRSVADEVIEKGNKNIEMTNVIIPRLTELVIHQQRPLRVRRIYAPDHPKFQSEETPE